MELQFQKQDLHCLQCVQSQVQNLEQTQELRLPDGMPGVDRILGCWGQILIRSKQWNRDSVRVSGGVQVWVLYQPEEGTGLRKLESWIPFQMDWDLPENCPEGTVEVLPLLRFADARPVSAGKVMIRVGLGLLTQCWIRQDAAVYGPEKVEEDVQLLRESWPLQLPREAGERVFELEEELTVPPAQPRPESLVYYRMEPGVQDVKVLANKVVFRGSGKVHLLYLCEDGEIHSWETELPFSQYAQLEGSYSGNAQAVVTMAVTSLDAENDPEGKLRLKASLAAQYLVTDRELVETVSDAWSPWREVQTQQQMLELAAQLDSSRATVSGVQTLPLEGTVVDLVLLPDFPRQHREGDSLTLEQTAQAQVLTRDGQGQLRIHNQRLEGQAPMKADEAAAMQAWPLGASLQSAEAGDSTQLHWEIPLQIKTSGAQGIPMVSALELGQVQEPDPGRPSLILRRAGTDRLWDIAKNSGSTVDAIMAANHLQSQPDPEKLLLIPVI